MQVNFIDGIPVPAGTDVLILNLGNGTFNNAGVIPAATPIVNGGTAITAIAEVQIFGCISNIVNGVNFNLSFEGPKEGFSLFILGTTNAAGLMTTPLLNAVNTVFNTDAALTANEISIESTTNSGTTTIWRYMLQDESPVTALPTGQMVIEISNLQGIYGIFTVQN